MPKDWCPFCPGSGKVPDCFDVYEYDNDFPALALDPPEPDNVVTDFFKVRPAYGKCEVILYSSEHNVTLAQLSLTHIQKLVNLWVERFNAIKQNEKIKYIFIFENRGDAVGVTMPHPHGQIYGYSYIPKKLQLELDACKEHYDEKGKCLLCDMLKEEQTFEKRIIFENEHFTCFLPFFH
jgi:UDPglucose--hexose-1-phosphate uridylyltransferase